MEVANEITADATIKLTEALTRSKDCGALLSAGTYFVGSIRLSTKLQTDMGIYRFPASKKEFTFLTRTRESLVDSKVSTFSSWLPRPSSVLETVLAFRENQRVVTIIAPAISNRNVSDPTF